MLDYVVIIAVLGFCFFWGAWRERVSDNRRDSGLLAVLGAATMLGSAGVYAMT